MDRMDVAAWLRGLGLERYVPAFREHEIDWEALPKVTAEDLKDLGVVLAGHRRKLLDAITAIGAEASAPGTAVIRAVQAATDAERRQLTIIFCDLVDSTPLSARLDPEDLREVIASYHSVVAEVVDDFDGFVSQYAGDGVLLILDSLSAIMHVAKAIESTERDQPTNAHKGWMPCICYLLL